MVIFECWEMTLAVLRTKCRPLFCASSIVMPFAVIWAVTSGSEEPMGRKPCLSSLELPEMVATT